MLKHFHRHVEEVVELPVDVVRRVLEEERDVGDGSVELFPDVFRRFLERLRELPEKFDDLVFGLFVEASKVLCVMVRLFDVVVVLVEAAVKVK